MDYRSASRQVGEAIGDRCKKMGAGGNPPAPTTSLRKGLTLTGSDPCRRGTGRDEPAISPPLLLYAGAPFGAASQGLLQPSPPIMACASCGR